MLTQRRKTVELVLISAGMSLLLVITSGQCAMLSEDPQINTTPPVVNSTLNTHLDNSSTVALEVHSSHRLCDSKDEGFCGNGGQCIYPQDNHKPACICKPSFTGPRCLYPMESHSGHEVEKVIAIVCGVTMIIFILMIIIYCCVRKR
uniref:EGF-like domain-containing protein n=1 Tax=Oryzias latipes TaxID=8090 RepID=A0A3P9LY47_ORYLA